MEDSGSRVVSHGTNVVEHPELIAERIIRLPM